MDRFIYMVGDNTCKILGDIGLNKLRLILDCNSSDNYQIGLITLFNADTLHLRLRANISEKQFLELFDISPNQKNKVDTDNF